PFDYPDNDPGPQTLLTTLTPEQNIDRLYWHLSRFQGYAGIANFMGARFTATDAVMQPIIREAAKRGLGYLDDGSSPRSAAPSLTAAQSMPFAKADFTVDAVPTSAEIDRTLVKLETLAKERGLAVGVAAALPTSIERLAAGIKTLDSRGIMLVRMTTVTRAAKRELYEETSVRSVEKLGEVPDWLIYDIPRTVAGRAWKGRYRGQRQKWFAVRFTGKDAEINVSSPGGGGHKAEFVNWRWEPMKNLPNLIVPFKRPVYERVVKEFA